MKYAYALFADENAITAQLLAIILAKKDPKMRLMHVTSRSETLDCLKRRGRFRSTPRPGVLFLDMDEPVISGFQVLQELKSDPELRSIPVVTLAGDRNPADVRRSYQLGANAYVVKPLNYRAFADYARALGSFWLSLNESPE